MREGALVARRVFSSSWWLCDCPGAFCAPAKMALGNSMGLILDARGVHVFLQDLRAARLRHAWSNKPDSIKPFIQ